MFKSLSLFALLLASASSVVSKPTEDVEQPKYLDIKAICKQTPKLGLFGQLLEERPDIYAAYCDLRDKTFYLPSDDALEAYYAATGSIFRRAVDDVAKASYQYVNGQVDLNDAREKKRLAKTSGDNKNTMVISSNAAKKKANKRQPTAGNDTVTTAGITVSTGLGTKSEILFGDIQCTQGLIQVVDTLFAVPVPITETLDCSDGSEFLSALNDADLADTYNEMGNVTFFVPQDGSFESNSTMDCASVQRHVVENKALYTPDLKDGDVIESASGDKLYVNVLEDEFYYINCVRVITTDNIVSNGVIHVVEKVIEPMSAPPSCWAKNITVEPVEFTGPALMNQAGSLLAIVGSLTALFFAL
ncbi:FAS1 domain-containing protein [Morchella snyderi]|nr:FAS1 domain-containing protein [Morchella snyderi]